MYSNLFEKISKNFTFLKIIELFESAQDLNCMQAISQKITGPWTTSTSSGDDENMEILLLLFLQWLFQKSWVFDPNIYCEVIETEKLTWQFWHVQSFDGIWSK